jgi:hypothetical protein
MKLRYDDPVRSLVLLILLSACSDDPALGDALWDAPVGAGVPSDGFTLAYAEHTGDTWTVHTVSYDEELHCSKARGVGNAGLTVELSNVAGDNIGEVPITVESLVPNQPGAHLELGTPTFDGGTIEVTGVGDAIEASFTAIAGDVTISGSFEATVCD